MEASSDIFDVIIVGGSYAGLSAAMALGRSRRKVLIVDSGLPCNRQTPHAHNLITHDGATPASIAQSAKEQVLAYSTVRFLQDKVIAASGTNCAFRIVTEKGAEHAAKKLLIATGVKDIPMPIDGFAACWGISILHCPYCHGYEVRDEKLGVIANGDMGFEYARLIRNWSQDLALFTNGPSTLNEEQSARLISNNIHIIEKEIAAVHHRSGYLDRIVFTDGAGYPLKAIFAKTTPELQGDIAKDLGCELNSEGMAIGLIKVDDFGKTTVAGVYAAGDNTTPMRSLANAIAGGTRAGAFINHELVAMDW